MWAYTLSVPGKVMSTVDSFSLAYQTVSTSIARRSNPPTLSPELVGRYRSPVVSLGHLLATAQPPTVWAGSRYISIGR